MTLKIGIPRALSYYSFFPMWKTFFEALSLEVVTSQATTKEILDHGIKEAVNDACVPVKLYYGHVLDLRDKVDYLFIPRLVSVNKEATFCPKFLGLPDMVRCSIKGLPPIIDTKFDLKRGPFEFWKIGYRIGKRIGSKPREIFRALHEARCIHQRYLKLLRNGMTPSQAIENLFGNPAALQPTKHNSLRFAVLGYPYTIHDSYMSVKMTEKLLKMGVDVITAEMLPEPTLQRQRHKLPKDLFWHYSNITVRAALHLLENKEIDGIIHVTAFGCGPDAIVDKLIELEAKQHGNLPFMSLTIDEHSGEAGIQTRLEAFTDMVKRKQEKAEIRRT